MLFVVAYQIPRTRRRRCCHTCRQRVDHCCMCAVKPPCIAQWYCPAATAATLRSRHRTLQKRAAHSGRHRADWRANCAQVGHARYKPECGVLTWHRRAVARGRSRAGPHRRPPEARRPHPVGHDTDRRAQEQADQPRHAKRRRSTADDDYNNNDKDNEQGRPFRHRGVWKNEPNGGVLSYIDRCCWNYHPTLCCRLCFDWKAIGSHCKPTRMAFSCAARSINPLCSHDPANRQQHLKHTGYAHEKWLYQDIDKVVVRARPLHLDVTITPARNYSFNKTLFRL